MDTTRLDRPAHRCVASMTASVRVVLPVGERARVVRLELNGEAFDYTAGQAVLVGLGGTERRCAYSIASPPELARRQGLIELLVSVGGSNGDCSLVTPGRTVTIEGPLGTFTFPTAPSQRQFVFIAGGTGIAPVRAMLRPALLVPHGHVAVLYSARTAEDFAYHDELRSLATSRQIQLRQTITRDARTGRWQGSRGRFGPQDLQPFIGENATLWFLCGPDSLIHDMRRHLWELGAAPDQIRTESVSPPYRSSQSVVPELRTRVRV